MGGRGGTTGGRLVRGVLCPAVWRRVSQLGWGPSAKFKVRCRRARTLSNGWILDWSPMPSGGAETCRMLPLGTNARISNRSMRAGYSLNRKSSHPCMSPRCLSCHCLPLLLLRAALMAYKAMCRSVLQGYPSDLSQSPLEAPSESGVNACHFCYHPGPTDLGTPKGKNQVFQSCTTSSSPGPAYGACWVSGGPSVCWALARPWVCPTGTRLSPCGSHTKAVKGSAKVTQQVTS